MKPGNGFFHLVKINRIIILLNVSGNSIILLIGRDGRIVLLNGEKLVCCAYVLWL